MLKAPKNTKKEACVHLWTRDELTLQFSWGGRQQGHGAAVQSEDVVRIEIRKIVSTWNRSQQALWIILSERVMISGKKHCCQMNFLGCFKHDKPSGI